MTRVYTDRWKNAQKLARQYPDTFEAPSESDLDNLAVGDYVKVCGAANERFWARIVELDGDKVVAKVDNILVVEENYNMGDLIFFRRWHIYSSQRPS